MLFIDAIGSTPFAERADPETVRAHQSGFFAIVRRTVRQYGGVVEKYIGDAVMVLFGAPVATETDAVRSVRAGLDLQRALAREADDGGWTFRVGIATGDALVDVAAAHDGGQAILAGDVVNTAARLQAAAPPGGVLICAATHLAARTEIRSVAQEPLTLRGRSTPTEVWLALAPVQQQVGEVTDAITMVGRDHELDLLTSALRHVIEERSPRLVTILGRAGIGKSRLVRELYQHAVTLVDTQVCWRSGRCQPFGENVAYAALADIVKAQAGVLATDTPQIARDRLDAALPDLVPAGQSERFSDALRPLLGLPGSPLSTEDAESAWRRFLLALAGRGPTVLVFEDLHWADDRMIRFIELIAATVRDVPLLVVCTARPELVDREPTWAGAVPGMLSISLTPLRDDSIATLYEQMFADAQFPPELLQALVGLADGIPLYAHEYGRMLVERGTLRRSADTSSSATWTMEPSDELPMPRNVHAVIANRIDLLDPAERAVLQAAAVVGPRFWPGAVAAALGTGTDTVERALRTLAQRDLVREQPDSTMADEPEYRFRHTLVSDVCYERIPLAERIARHTRAADWLDARVDSRGTELADVVAHHRFTAHETARTLGLDAGLYAAPALAALLNAGRRAAMVNAYDVAAIQVARANQLISSAPLLDSGDLGTDRFAADRLGVELLATELALHQNSAAFLAGAGPTRLAELATLLYRVRDHGGAARAWTLLGQIAWLGSDRPAALRCLDRAVELLDSWPDTPEKAQTYAELGRLHMLNYEHVPALGAAQIAAEIAERLGLVELRANTLITIGMCRYQAGDPAGLAELQASLDFCQAHQLPSERRAAQSVAFALREEGNRARPGALPPSSSSPVAPGLVVAGLPSREDLRPAGLVVADAQAIRDHAISALVAPTPVLGSPVLSSPVLSSPVLGSPVLGSPVVGRSGPGGPVADRSGVGGPLDVADDDPTPPAGPLTAQAADLLRAAATASTASPSGPDASAVARIPGQRTDADPFPTGFADAFSAGVAGASAGASPGPRDGPRLFDTGALPQDPPLLDGPPLLGGGGQRASAKALNALYAGDWDDFFALADRYLDTPAAEPDVRVRGARGWMRALRGDATGAARDAADALSTARSSGFWRPTWTALANGALCEALLQRQADAEELLRELTDGWRRMRTIASGEWVAAAGHAAARLGADAAHLLREALADAPHQTAWSRAALATVDGSLASARGDHTAAALHHLDAAERYAGVDSATDRMLALGGAVRALRAAADARPAGARPTDFTATVARATAAGAELAAFAGRNRIVSAL